MDEAGLLRYAAGRGGVFTRAAAYSFGASAKRLRNLLDRGVVVEVLDDTFHSVASPFTWASRMFAATDWASPAAVSHRAAASLWELDGFADPPVELTTERRVHQPSMDLVIHRTPRFDPAVLRVRAGLPVTSIEQTIGNLGAVCSPGKVAQGLDDALRQRSTTLDRLVEHLDTYSRKGRSGLGVLRRLLIERVSDGYMESLFEKALLRLVHRYGLPPPKKQHPVEIDGRHFRIDFAYLPERIAIEAMGYAFHSLRDDWERDQDRNSLLTLDGWRILHITYRQLWDRPDEVARRIRAALAAFSSPGGAL